MLLSGLEVGIAGSLTGSLVKSLPWMLKVLFLIVGGIMLTFHVIASPKRYPKIISFAMLSLTVGCSKKQGDGSFASLVFYDRIIIKR